MKVCVTSYGPTLDSRPQPVFGRSEYLIFVDTENMEFESVSNSNALESDDCGILSANLVVNRGASVIISDHVGPATKTVLDAANVEVRHSEGHSVREVVEHFKNHP